jgi:hypothetical protein
MLVRNQLFNVDNHETRVDSSFVSELLCTGSHRSLLARGERNPVACGDRRSFGARFKLWEFTISVYWSTEFSELVQGQREDLERRFTPGSPRGSWTNRPDRCRACALLSKGCVGKSSFIDHAARRISRTGRCRLPSI